MLALTAFFSLPLAALCMPQATAAPSSAAVASAAPSASASATTINATYTIPLDIVATQEALGFSILTPVVNGSATPTLFTFSTTSDGASATAYAEIGNYSYYAVGTVVVSNATTAITADCTWNATLTSTVTALPDTNATAAAGSSAAASSVLSSASGSSDGNATITGYAALCTATATIGSVTTSLTESDFAVAATYGTDGIFSYDPTATFVTASASGSASSAASSTSS